MTLDVYTRADADPTALAGSTVAVIGYGNLGSSMAGNLAASGLSVVVGNRDDEYRAAAAADGFAVADIGAAVAGADVVYVLISDEAIPACFDEIIAPALRPAQRRVLRIRLLPGVRLGDPADRRRRPAPRSAHGRQRRAARWAGYVAYLNVEHDASGRAKERLLALALAAGALDRGAFGVTAVDEAALDLFVEQIGRTVRRAGDPARLRGRCGRRAATRGARARAVPVRRDGRGLPQLRRAGLLPGRRRAWRHGAVRRLPADARARHGGDASRSSPPCSTTSAAEGSPRSSKPTPRRARRRLS